jgi:hypothetical protein
MGIQEVTVTGTGEVEEEATTEIHDALAHNPYFQRK